jgi:hypothetical protein
MYLSFLVRPEMDSFRWPKPPERFSSYPSKDLPITQREALLVPIWIVLL